MWQVDAVLASCPSLKHRIVVGAGEHVLPGWHRMEDLCEPESPVVHPRFKFKSTDPMMVYFTSGTTAPPKMVQHDMAYAYAHQTTGLFWLNSHENDVHWTLTDTGWAKAAWGMLFPQLLMGVSTVIYDTAGFDPVAHLRLIEQHKVSTFCAPPTAYRVFCQQNLSEFDLSSLRRCVGAGEPLNPEVIRYWEQHTGTLIADGYGQTESVNIVANLPSMPTKQGSMGKPVPGFDVDIVDDSGKRLPTCQTGHIALHCGADRPWPPGLFRGYGHGQHDLDTKPFKGDWYYTGDMARKDEDGYIWFEGRADDLITSSGYRISPFEVESALLEHCLLYTSDAADEEDSVDLGGRRII
eukprot:TRINITY_DN12109_c0_g1_i2.p1 TRINITY_DN12109_c0_g1~~TRINITY_DN12109_c0_g1_i2.p1  ORF type:complete len:352 (+),score=63.06 TRINITY_DN12109_c0_g1_i2:558-1613(+)